jgi:hypothetical protein
MSAVEGLGMSPKEGTLAALGGKANSWKDRYFLVKDNFMHYMKTKSVSLLCGSYFRVSNRGSTFHGGSNFRILNSGSNFRIDVQTFL